MTTLSQLRKALPDHDAEAIIAALAAAGLRIAPMPARRSGNRALAFHEAFQAAKRAASAELGARWSFVPGQSQWITLPSSLANYRFTRSDGTDSVTIHNPRDYRAPASRFWPGARIPDGAIVGEG